MNKFRVLLAFAMLTTGAVAHARPYEGSGFCAAPEGHERYVRFLYWFIRC